MSGELPPGWAMARLEQLVAPSLDFHAAKFA